MTLTMIPLPLPALLSTLAALAQIASTPARAADYSQPSTTEVSKADKLSAARALIAEGRWRDAIAQLHKVNDSGSADWNNLMGYSYRKTGTPDLAAAERYYNEALRIDPAHRGALEYSGELYLMMGDLPRAEARLAALDKTCTFGCDELKALKAAIARYKTNGNRYLPGA